MHSTLVFDIGGVGFLSPLSGVGHGGGWGCIWLVGFPLFVVDGEVRLNGAEWISLTSSLISTIVYGCYVHVLDKCSLLTAVRCVSESSSATVGPE